MCIMLLCVSRAHACMCARDHSMKSRAHAHSLQSRTHESHTVGTRSRHAQVDKFKNSVDTARIRCMLFSISSSSSSRQLSTSDNNQQYNHVVCAARRQEHESLVAEEEADLGRCVVHDSLDSSIHTLAECTYTCLTMSLSLAENELRTPAAKPSELKSDFSRDLR